MTTLQTVQRILQVNFNLAPEALHPEAKLADLEIDSLAIIEVMFAVEEEFGIEVPADTAAMQSQIKTVGDLSAYVDKLVGEQSPGTATGAAGP